MKESEQIQTCLHWLKRRGFDARFAENREVARKMLVDMVPFDWIIGCGDSATIRSLGVLQDLTDRGNRVLNNFFKPKIMREKPEPTPLHVINQATHGCDVFLASSNAVTLDGKIVNIDGGGNRVSGIIFGSKLRVLVIGKNKIAKDIDEALWRIKNITQVYHSMVVHPTPDRKCVAAGKCIEPETFCDGGVGRGCNVVVILEGHPNMAGSKLVPILVDEDLGLGWDPSWPQERIDRIYSEYKKFTPPHRPTKAN